MTCETCGEKPKNTSKDFTKAVIEIENPETLVLLRKVVIPASMGNDIEVPATIGKYHNVILKYEANNHVYLYSSDGIPTLLEMDVPQEILDKIDDLDETTTGLSTQIDNLEKSLDYSLLEIDTGTTWIDGTPIYKKTINYGALPNSTSHGVNHGIANLSKIIKMEGYAYAPTFMLFNALSASSLTLGATDEQVEIQTTTNWSQFTECYVTLYYTKTA